MWTVSSTDQEKIEARYASVKACSGRSTYDGGWSVRKPDGRVSLCP